MNLTIICDDHPVTVDEDILKKIPYFEAMLRGNYREKADQVIQLEGVSSEVLENITNYAYHGQISRPNLTLAEDCLALGQYFVYDQYINDLLEKIIEHDGKVKSHYVQIINLISLAGQLKYHLGWIERILPYVNTIPRIHMLQEEAVTEIVNLFHQHRSYNKYIFALLRDWYLFDRVSSKVAVVKKLMPYCKLDRTALSPKYQTKAFIESFPDPDVAKKIALWLLQQYDLPL